MLGYQSAIGFGEETSLATAAAPTDWIKYSSEGFTKTFNESLDETINGSREIDDRVTMEEPVDGNVAFPMRPVMGEAKLFKHLAGNNYTKTSLTTGVFQYDFVIGAVTTSTSLSWTKVINNALTSTVFRYTGQRCGSASFETSVGGMLNASMDFMGVDVEAYNTLPTASYSSNSPYTFKNATLKIGNDDGDATSTCVDSATFNFAGNLIEDYCLGSASRSAIEDGSLDINGTFNAKYNSDNAILNRFLNQTKTYIECEYDSGVTISGAYTHKITFKCYNCYFNGSMPQIGGRDEIIKHEIPFKAIKESATYGSMLVTLITSTDLA